ncbi:MAG TPA: response regulator [Candidatus Methanoperedens sp.]|nr:response regulator [Candidatus Methanoperedens sp.]
MKILIVEDNSDSRLVLQKNLEHAGHTVVGAVNGRDALEKAREHRPDLIVSDILMPEMDGFGLCREIKSDERLRGKPFVFYTATYVDPADERLALSLGASRFILKPAENEEFLRIIDEVVREAHQGDLPVPDKPLADQAKLRKTHENRVGEKLDKKIRELAAAREQFREVERSYQDLFSSMRDVIVVADLERTITDANQPALRDLFGYELDEIKGRKTRVLYADDEGYRRLGAMIFSKADPSEAVVTEADFRKKDGSVFPGELSAQKLKDANGNLIGNIGIIRDITERKRAEVFLRRIIDSIGEGIAVVDREYRVILANSAYCGREVSPPVFEGRYCYEVLRNQPGPCHESGIECPATKTFKTGKPGAASFTHPAGRGRAIAREIMTFPMMDASGEVTAVIEVTKDVTEQRSLEAQLRQAQKMEAVGRLAGGVAHDFNNMLGVIIGHAEIGLLRVAPPDPLCRDFLEIRKAALRSADLTRQLLAFSRKQVVSPHVLDLNRVIEDQRRMLGRLVGEDIELRFVPAVDLWKIRIDPSQVDQILANLAVNARDAITGVGTITVETANVTLDVAYCRAVQVTPGDYVLIAFSDTGCGMDAATSERIFEPFFTTKEEGKGTGLGLSTVYGIVRQQEGDIHVYSQPGLGTTFKIYLPRCREEGEQTVEEPKVMALAGSETVLLVEDEVQILVLAQEILERYGYMVLAARTPGEACLMAEKHPGSIHLLLTDVVMPGMNGRELCERVAAIKPGIKVLFMSGYTADIIAHRGVIDEGVEFIQKPFSVASLAEKVRAVLDA